MSALSSALFSAALLARVEEIASDLGRLRRRFDSNADAWTGAYIVDRLAHHVQTLDAMLHASAGELAQHGADLEQALTIVDARRAHLDQLLGEANR